MTWINVISYEAAEGKVRTLYDRVKGPENNVDNIMMLHSLRPHSMEAHMTMYKYVLHHTGNSIPKWFLETLGVWVSRLNDCDYCVEHHFAGLERLLADDTKSTAIRKAIEARNIDAAPLDNAQKCAGVHIKTKRNKTQGPVSSSEPVAVQPIKTGAAPDAPPMTIF